MYDYYQHNYVQYNYDCDQDLLSYDYYQHGYDLHNNEYIIFIILITGMIMVMINIINYDHDQHHCDSSNYDND